MSKKKWELHKMISPEKAKFLKLTNPNPAELLKSLKAIDWSKERRVFLDLGESYAYNPHTSFYQRREAFYSASFEDAPQLLARLCTEAEESGVELATILEWARQQTERWYKERRWDSLNG
jgi:hypothetical protein